MKWVKKGVIQEPDKDLWWSQKYCILPTPIYLESKNVLRIYYATTCSENFGRVTHVDLDPDNPSRIINYSKKINLDIGEIGAFDDCGVNPSCVLFQNNSFHMYYVGFQRHFRAPYSILSGMAISDNGIDFERIQKTPILERTTDELNLRSAPTVIKINNKYHMWYVSSLGWEKMLDGVHVGKLMPKYCIKYSSSDDGMSWGQSSGPLFKHSEDEFGFGRPWIYKNEMNQTYYLFYSVRSRSKPYRLGVAISSDLISWKRIDEQVGIDVSGHGWDSEMICYPSVIKVKDKTYLFFNGNNNGETGFGYAELDGVM